MLKKNIVDIKKIIYIYCFTCFFQSMFLTIHLKFFELSINRIFFLIFLLDFAVRTLKKGVIDIPNQYSFKFIWVWALYSAFLLAAALLKNKLALWMKLFYFVLTYLILMTALDKYVCRKKDFCRLFFYMQPGILLQALLGLYECLTGNYYFTVYNIEKRYPCAMQVNPNDFALLMSAGFFISIACFRLTKKRMLKVLNILAALFYLYMNMLAESRSGLLFIVFGVFAGGMTALKQGKIFRCNALKIALLLCIPFGGYLLMLLVKAVSYIQWVFFTNVISSDHTRIQIYINGFQEFIKTFGLGSGYYIGALHCYWLEILFDFGIFIFAAFCFFYARLLFKMARINNDKDRTVSITASCFIQIAAGLVIGSLGPASTLSIEWISLMLAAAAVFEKKYNSRRIGEDA